MGLRTVTFKCPDFVVEELDRIALIVGVERSQLIRYAVAELIKRFGSGRLDVPQPRMKWRVIHVKLSPPPDNVNDGAGLPKHERPTCREVMEARMRLSWAEVAEAWAYMTRLTEVVKG